MFAIVTVCTGNVCRSPIAEQLLRTRLPHERFAVSSGGLAALVGEQMPDEAVAVSRHYGGDPSGHLARQLTREQVAEADLVLTAELGHRAEVVRLHPRASRYAFTLRQFARLADAIDDEELATFTDSDDVLAAVALRRGYIAAAAPAEDEVADPFRRSTADYERAGREIAAAVGSAVRVLTGLGER